VKSEVLYGIHSVYEALAADRRHLFEIYIEKKKKSKRLEAIANLAESRNLALKEVAAAQLNSMAGSTGHQGVAAKVGAYPLAEIGDILAGSRQANGGRFILLLDNIQDPHNLGALIRTAVCLGIDGVVIPKDRSVSPSPSVSKASAGALEHVLLARVNNLVRTVESLKGFGFWVVGLDPAAQQSILESDLTGALAVVIGGEEKGIRPLVKRNCDFMISIPRIGALNSLNASVAGAIAIYESFRQRQAQKLKP
jgi:23S rRNA (guanosine2251-2'-O)-methyltransferase